MANMECDFKQEALPTDGAAIRVASGQVWQHKNGKRYFVLGISNEGNPLTDDNNPPIVDYMGGPGVKHSRYLSSWAGSFTYLGRL